MADINKKILIIEDDKDFLWILRQGLIKEGFTAIAAEDGLEGLLAVEKEKPALILLDIAMPKMDGIAVAKKLKESNIHVPIIFLTNMKDEKYISDAIEIVPETEYIVKSDLGINSIVERVKNRLNLK